MPTLIFVNKIDRPGASDERVLQAISERLTPAVVPIGSARRLGTRAAGFTPWSAADADFEARLASAVAERDDAILAAYVDDEASLSYGRLREELAAQTKQALLHPVFFGSALTGAGVEPLLAGIAELLPAAAGDPGAAASGTVFKVERGKAGEKVAYVRMFSGTVRVRERLQFGRAAERKVTAIDVFDRGSAVQRSSVSAGQIGRLWGLSEIQIGDTIGSVRAAAADHHFAPPTLETVVVPNAAADKGRLRVALAQLAEQDPLINVRQDDARQEIAVSLYGEVQKEVIQATLADDFGVDVGFRETTTICIERPVGTGEAVETLHEASNPFLAGIGLRVEPAAAGAGVEFLLEVELGAMPYSFFRAVEETVRGTLQQGIYGWEVPDCVVSMMHSGYAPRQSHAHQGFDKSMSSTAGDFRNLTPLVLMSALEQAGSMVYEPIDRFALDVPAESLGVVLPALARLHAIPQTQTTRGLSCTVEGSIPAARVRQLRQELPALTHGEGVLECFFDRYQPVAGAIPRRARFDNNPLNREEYLLRVARRLAGR